MNYGISEGRKQISCERNKHVCPSCCAVQTVVKYKIVLRISFFIVKSPCCAHNALCDVSKITCNTQCLLLAMVARHYNNMAWCWIRFFLLITKWILLLPNSTWLLQLVISSPLIHTLGDPSQVPTGSPDWEVDDLPTELSLPRPIVVNKL